MSTKKFVVIVALMVLMATEPTAWGQRGIGDKGGVARQAIDTQRIDIEGTVREIVIEKCENTTGPFGIGMHLLLTTSEEEQYNVHLGPAALIKDMLKPLEAGQSVTVQAFRTQKMRAKDLVAIALKFDGKTVRLRDENLQPIWAGGQGRFFGRYEVRSELPRWRQAYGRGYGTGYGKGCRTGFGRGMGLGYGRGWINGMGYGRGRRGVRGQGRSPGYGYGPRYYPRGASPTCPRLYGW